MTAPRYVPTAAAESLICRVLEHVPDDDWDEFLDALRGDPDGVIEALEDVLRRFAAA